MQLLRTGQNFQLLIELLWSKVSTQHHSSPSRSKKKENRQFNRSDSTIDNWVTFVAVYRATACNATHGIAVAILSVCPSVYPSVCSSVRCVYCDKIKQRTANILIPHETAITLVFWHQQWLVGYAPFPLKSALKVTHPLRKTPTSTDFRS